MGDLAVPFGVKEEVLVSLRVVSFKGPPREPFGYSTAGELSLTDSCLNPQPGGVGGEEIFS